MSWQDCDTAQCRFTAAELSPIELVIVPRARDLGGFEVRRTKLIELDLAETDPAVAEERVREMCEKLPANPVIESYRVEIG